MPITAVALATYLAVATGATGLVSGLYDLAKELYGDYDRDRSGKNKIEPDKIGHICDQLYLYRNSPSIQENVLRRYSEEIIGQASVIRGRLSLYDRKLADDVYKNVVQETVISPQKSGKYKQMSPKKAALVASIIALASLSLTYFTLFPEKPTAHTITSISLNVIGIFLSFILLSLGSWLVMRKIN